MPVPGPRTQERPLPGYTNPRGDQPTRINHWKRPGPVREPGRSPATMVLSLRGNILAPGQVRRVWQQTVNHIAAQAPFSWTYNSPAPDRPGLHYPGYMITRAVRYMARSVYIAGGTDNTRFGALHTKITPRVNSKPVTVGAGAVRNRPTVRNRLTSFGSRVTPLNARMAAAMTDEDMKDAGNE